MSGSKFNIANSAAMQMAMLPREDKAALNKALDGLFSSADVESSTTTRATGAGRFVSRLGTKRILWRRSDQKKPEVLSIVDQSFALGG